MKIFDYYRKIKSKFSHYQPLVEILISKNNLLHNLHEYQKDYPHLSFAPVLKSNAYGHGLIPVAKILDQEKIAFFAVDSLYEAKILRNNNIKSDILIIGYTLAQNIINSKIRNTAFAITSLEQLKEINSSLLSAKKIHLKIDTGMHRQGILPDQISEAIEIIKNNKFLELEGVLSHFADADNIDKTFTQVQINNWESVVSSLKQSFSDIKYFHLSATSGTPYTDQIQNNTARLGLGLYGINPSPFTELDLKPVLKMESVIGTIKTIPAGEHVGYNGTYIAEKTITTATVPVGYFEGVDRRLSNCGFFKLGNTFCPIIGRVSMDITSIDITDAQKVKLNDKIIVISDKPEDKNSIENIAKTAQTIPYEILIHLPQHLKRTVI